eukprot:761405-Hanusia_phi.AAC.2
MQRTYLLLLSLALICVSSCPRGIVASARKPSDCPHSQSCPDTLLLAYAVHGVCEAWSPVHGPHRSSSKQGTAYHLLSLLQQESQDSTCARCSFAPESLDLLCAGAAIRSSPPRRVDHEGPSPRHRHSDARQFLSYQCPPCQGQGTVVQSILRL